MKQDARKLSGQSLTDLRKRAVASVQDGNSPEDVAATFGICRAALYNWLAMYRGGGWDALNARKRGGRPRLLTGKQMQWIYKTVTGRNPLQMRFPFALWTLDMVRIVIRRHLGIELSRASAGRLMEQLGLSAQRPLWRAYQQNPAMVAKWMREEYPRICEVAKASGALIFFGDEAGVRSDAHAGTTWAPRGRTPIVSTTGQRFGMNLISAINRRGQMHFNVVKGRVTADVFVEFLKRLIRGRQRPIFLIVDGHPTHKSTAVKRFVENVKDRLQLFLLPPYSPELNPDEFVWNDLKTHMLGRMKITNAGQMQKSVLGRLRWMKSRPNHVASFFHAPHTQYAA